MFVARKYFCRDKHTFVATKDVFVKVSLSRKKFIYKSFVAKKFCRDKHTFVATKDVFCRDKHVFVATKMILVAAPANDKPERLTIDIIIT